MNTEAISGRSAGRPVSFSTIDARISASSGDVERQAGRALLPGGGEPRSSSRRARAAAAPGRCCRPRRNRCRGRTGLPHPAPARPAAPSVRRPEGRAPCSGPAPPARNARRTSANVEPSMIANDVCVTSPCVRRAQQFAQRDVRLDLVASRLDRAVHALHARQRDHRPRLRQHIGAPAIRARRRTASCPVLHFELERRLRQRQRHRDDPPREAGRRRSCRAGWRRRGTGQREAGSCGSREGVLGNEYCAAGAPGMAPAHA